MQALGTIEVVGLVAGIEAADVACKAADVKLIGYELAKGGGYVTIKVEGQVGAVKAAMSAAEAAASKLARIVSVLVIPRPHRDTETLVYSKDTVGLTAPEQPSKPPAPEPQPTWAKPTEEAPKAQEPGAKPVDEIPEAEVTPAEPEPQPVQTPSTKAPVKETARQPRTGGATPTRRNRRKQS